MRERGARQNWLRAVVIPLVLLTAASQARGQGPGQASSAAPLTLDSAIADALATHPSLQAARAAVERADAGREEARSAWLPSLSLDAGVMRYQDPMVVAPLHGLDLLHPPVFDNTLAQGGVSLGWTLFDGGVRGARGGRARALEGAAESGLEGATLKLLSDVSRAYLQVHATREVVDAHDRQVAALAAERDRATKVFDQGRAARVAVLRAQAALAQAQAEREAARMDQELAERNLARFMGVSAERVSGAVLPALRLRDSVAAPAAGGSPGVGAPAAAAPATRAAPGAAARANTAASADWLPAREQALQQALASNPELMALRRQEEAARAGTAESRALWMPRLQLVGRLAEFGSADYSPSHEWQGGVQLSYPLFTGGSRLAAGERAQADLRSARAQLAQAKLELEGEVDQALAAVRSARARVAALETAVAQSEEVARIEKLALDAGSGVQTDYLTAEAQLLGVRASLTQARAAEASARIELARVTGELSRQWLRNNLDAVESER